MKKGLAIVAGATIGAVITTIVVKRVKKSAEIALVDVAMKMAEDLEVVRQDVTIEESEIINDQQADVTIEESEIINDQQVEVTADDEDSDEKARLELLEKRLEEAERWQEMIEAEQERTRKKEEELEARRKEPIDMGLELKEITKELSDRYPIEWQYGSMCSLWQRGLTDNAVTQEMYNEAEEFYGATWHYTGD